MTDKDKDIVEAHNQEDSDMQATAEKYDDDYVMFPNLGPKGSKGITLGLMRKAEKMKRDDQQSDKSDPSNLTKFFKK